MKKFRINDGDETYEITELEDEDEIAEETKGKADDDEVAVLTSEEIASLKELAKAAPSLLALLNKPEETSEEIDEEIDGEDMDEDEDEEVEEEIVDTDEKVEKKKGKDSKKSYGSIQKTKIIEDSLEEDEISSAWSKRYGGK